VRLDGGLVNVACAAGETVIVLVFVIEPLPHGSWKVHVSVITPPHAPGGVVCVDVTQPAITQLPEAPLLYDKQDGAGILPHDTLRFSGELVNAATGAGFTVIVLV
jgi:hypothetical protein